jgi:hypothetical protein
MGEILTIRTLSGLQKATVVEPCAFDPQGERLNA